MTGKYQRYAEYKNSGFDAVRRIPISWTVSKVRFQFTFGKGLTITKENLRDTGLPCVNYGEVHSRFGFEVSTKTHSLKCVDESYLRTNKSSRLEVGDLVFADTSEDIEGAGNFTQLVHGTDVFAGYHTIIVRPLKKEASRFWAYLFDSIEFRNQIRTTVKGVKVFSVTQAILRSLNVWLPPFEERLAIANFLDHETAKIDALIEKQKKLIELLKEKRQAVISHAVTKGLNPDVLMKDSGIEWLGEVPEHWTLPSLLHITSKIGDGLHSTPSYEDGTGLYFVNGNNLVNGCIQIGPTAKEVPLSEYLKYKLDLNERTVFLSINGTVGNVALYDGEPIILGKSAAYINLAKNIDPNFISWFLSSSQSKKYFELEVTGTTIHNLSLSSIRKMAVALPHIEEQRKITTYCFQQNMVYKKLISSANEIIELLLERRKALISAAVTGKIDVRNWQPNSKEKAYA